MNEHGQIEILREGKKAGWRGEGMNVIGLYVRLDQDE